MSRVGVEPTNPAFERGKTVHALARAATVIGFSVVPIKSVFLQLIYKSSVPTSQETSRFRCKGQPVNPV
jgi:hypothetical protein